MGDAPRVRPVLRLWRRGRVSADVHDEFAFHLDMRAAELLARGMTAADARAEAIRQFGDVDDATMYCRRTGERREKRTMRTEWFAGLRQDLAFGWRTLVRAPGFTIVAALTLALGIGANTAIFSVVRGILLRPLPFGRPQELVMVKAAYNGSSSAWSAPNAYDIRDQNHSLSGASVVGTSSKVLTGVGDPERLRGADVAGNFFTVLGVPPLLGRNTFTPEESAWNGPKAVVLGEALWRTRFGGNRSIVGTMITLDDERYQVIGVTPQASAWPSSASYWVPFAVDPAHLEQSRGAVYLALLARLKPGVPIRTATTEVAGIMQRLSKQYPDVNTGMSATLVPLQEWITGSLRTPLLVLLGGVGFVLLIACANVANLLLVRGVSRESELAVRTALGAGRGRLLRQLVTESTVLALIGGTAAAALAVAGTRLLVRAAPPTIPRLDAIHVDAGVLAFTFAIAIVTGVLFGLIPARQTIRPDLARTLREGGRGGGSRAGGHRLRRALVVVEVALSVMLLAGAGLLIRSFDRLTRVDPGFRTDHSISFALSLPRAKYDPLEKAGAFVATMMDRIRALPGVTSAGAGFGMPLTPFGFDFSFEVGGRPPVKPADQPAAEVRVATPDYFTAMAIPVIKGRGFTAADRAGAPRVLLITSTAARQFFPHEDPLGKHVTFGWSRRGMSFGGDIVGVVQDVKQSSLAATTLPQFWGAFDQWPMMSFNIIMHTRADPAGAVSGARQVIRDLDPDLAVSQVKTLDQIVAESVAQPRFYMTLLAVFAVIAMLLSAIGIYGVIAYLVGQRSREIGIRIALGAAPSDVVTMILREGAVMIAVGLGVGVAGALALTQFMKSLLFNTPPTDLFTYGVVVIALAAVALVASGVPALRAARVDPALAMRSE